MMDRRVFLKLTGVLAAASALDVLPAAAQSMAPAAPEPAPLQAPGTYQFSGRVRIDAPLVEISGITNAQQLSWSGSAPPQATTFTSFEQFDRPWRMPRVQVRGGALEALAVVPVDLG